MYKFEKVTPEHFTENAVVDFRVRDDGFDLKVVNNPINNKYGYILTSYGAEVSSAVFNDLASLNEVLQLVWHIPYIDDEIIYGGDILLANKKLEEYCNQHSLDVADFIIIKKDFDGLATFQVLTFAEMLQEK